MKKIVMLSLLLSAGVSFGQFTSSIQLGYTHDSNAFGNFAEVPDGYMTFGLNLDNSTSWDYSSLDLSYNGLVSSYDTYPEQDAWSHYLGAAYRIQLSRVGEGMEDEDRGDGPGSQTGIPADSLESYLTLSGTLTRTVPHSGDFIAYQNFTTSGHAGLRQPFGSAALLRLGYTINYTGYDYISSLSNLENYGAVSLSFPVGSAVAFHIDGSLGNKKYYGVDTSSTFVRNLINMHSKGQYSGKGKGKNGGGTMPPSSSAKSYVLDSPSATQATYGGGVDYVSGGWKGSGAIILRRNGSGDARFVNAVAKFSAGGSQVYDDPYSYRGTEVMLALAKDSLFLGVGASVRLHFAGKDYSRAAFDTSQTVVLADGRHDNYTGLSVALTRTFGMSGVISGFTVGLEYDHVANSSNDEFYNYSDDVISLTLGVNLF